MTPIARAMAEGAASVFDAAVNARFLPYQHAMIDVKLLELLRCPQDGSRLTAAKPELIEDLNQRIMDDQVTNLSGAKVTEPMDGGLVRTSDDLLYPIVDGIPVMLLEEAIELG